MQRINQLKLLIQNSGMFDPINHLEAELFELENSHKVEIITETVTAVYTLPETCNHCNGRLMHNELEGETVCLDCGMTDRYTYNPENPGWSDSHDFSLKYRYQRIKHFKEQLLNFSGNETKTIPVKILNKVKNELTERTRQGVLIVLKKHGLIKYYPNVNLIAYIVLGIKPDYINTDLQEKLVEMFTDSQKPYDTFKGSGRKNFFNYNWTLYKFLEILNVTNPELRSINYISNYSVMKKRSINKAYDKIFEQICSTLDWPFIPSIILKK